MSTLTLGARPEDFWWASGVENTVVPQSKPGHRVLDEFELISHYQNWKDDIKLAKHLGVQALRWGAPWNHVEPRPGVFDWSWTDEVLPFIVEEMGMVPIVDLMHFGCPMWLTREFANKDYPETVARYAAAFATRYRGLIHYYTPLNEPVVNSLMCGQRGLWPPYLRGESGYVRIILQLARGIVRTTAALREIVPEATLVFVEATGLTRTASAELEPLAVEDQHRGFICFDLITGQVRRDHPLYTWILRNGGAPAVLDELARNPVKIDVMGMNFYPQWSVKQLYIGKNGRLASRIFEGGDSFAALIDDYYRRYRVPIMITETSAFGSDEVRAAWLRGSVAGIKHLRSRGVPVCGYTWFPMHTMFDWRYRLGTEPADHYRMELGMFSLNNDPAGPRWLPTPLVEQFRSYVDDPENSVGAIHERSVEITV